MHQMYSLLIERKREIGVFCPVRADEVTSLPFKLHVTLPSELAAQKWRCGITGTLAAKKSSALGDLFHPPKSKVYLLPGFNPRALECFHATAHQLMVTVLWFLHCAVENRM